MADRIDALGQRPERRAAFTGRILAPELDDQLQAFVEEAARELRAPIALVSLVLEHTQFFRAHVGLPADLAAVRATDRDASFCQLVVRDEAVLDVGDAPNDDRVPQDLVDRYGIRAYLGEPVEANGEVLGSLCVIDLEPRSFSDSEKALLHQLAQRVNQRLTALAETRAWEEQHALIDRAVTPAFGEVRNLLAPLLLNISSARLATTELAPLARLAGLLGEDSPVPAAGALVTAGAALGDLVESLADMETAVVRLERSVSALEKLTTASPLELNLSEVIEAATELAHHHTKLVGGVRWEGVQPAHRIRTPRSGAIALVSATLTSLSARIREHADRAGLTVRVTSEDSGATLLAFGANAAFDAQQVAESLASLVPGGSSLAVKARGSHVVVFL